MAKWVYTIDEKPKVLSQFPLISRPGKETLHYNNKEKVIILVKQFFLLPIKVDFSDISSFTYPKPQTVKKEVNEEDIIVILKGLAPDKAPNPKKIINQFLKTCKKQLILILAKLFSSCIAILKYTVLILSESIDWLKFGAGHLIRDVLPHQNTNTTALAMHPPIVGK